MYLKNHFLCLCAPRWGRRFLSPFPSRLYFAIRPLWRVLSSLVGMSKYFKFIELLFSGVSYLDFPANLLGQRISSSSLVPSPKVVEPTLPWPGISELKKAARLIFDAKAPLVIIGKGMFFPIITLIWLPSRTRSPNSN